MSLFGDSPPATPSFAGNRASALFDGESEQPKPTGSSLFTENSTSSPWSMPTPKRNARQNLVKTLLPADEVPDSYVDAFDTLICSEEGSTSSLGVSTVRKVLGSSGLSHAQQDQILQTVCPSRDATSIGRGEFNVLLALIGLAKEQEDLSLDSVDERRRSKSFSSVASRRSANPPRTTTTSYCIHRRA